MKRAGWIAAGAGLVLVGILLLGNRGFYPGPSESERAGSYPPPRASVESIRRQAERITVRVRAELCDQLFAGSGVIRGQEILTNRHVIDRAREIEINTWDGGSYRAGRPIEVTDKVDIGRFAFAGPGQPTEAARERPEPGAELLLAGYPRGEELSVVRGELLGYADGQEVRNLKSDSDVMVVRASIWRGDSGGPVLDSQGDLVGIIYAGAFGEKKDRDRSKTAFVVPIDEVDRLGADDYRKVKPCQLPGPASVSLGASR